MIDIKNLRNEKPSNPWDVRVDRGYSVLANPFKMKEDTEEERNRVCDEYNKWLLANRNEEYVKNEISRLISILKQYGQLNLFCWCVPKRCHALAIKAMIGVEMKHQQYGDKFYLLVVGTRYFNDYTLLCQKIKWAVQKRKEKIVIVSGGAQGADALAKKYAKDNNLEYIEFPAEWEKYGKAAGYRRNEQMHAFIASKTNRGCLAFWDGQSKGTAHSFELAKKYNNRVIVIRYDKGE